MLFLIDFLLKIRPFTFQSVGENLYFVLYSFEWKSFESTIITHTHGEGGSQLEYCILLQLPLSLVLLLVRFVGLHSECNLISKRTLCVCFSQAYTLHADTEHVAVLVCVYVCVCVCGGGVCVSVWCMSE
jgi:hypothetical protein